MLNIKEDKGLISLYLQKMDSILNEFAEHTRQPTHLTRTELAQRWIALHLSPPAVVAETYTLIANCNPSEYALMELQTHAPTLAERRDKDLNAKEAAAFVDMMEKGMPKQRVFACIPRAFVDASFPPSFPHGKDEESWKPHYQDHWKVAAAYIASARMNSAILTKLDETFALYDRVRAVKKHLPPFSLKVAAELIGMLNLEKVECGACSVEEDKKKEEEEEDLLPPLVEAQATFLVCAPMPAAPSSVVPIVSYCRRAGLNAVFSPKKTTQQVLLSRLNLSAAVQASMLGMYQACIAGQVTDEEWLVAQSNLASLATSEQLEQLARTRVGQYLLEQEPTLTAPDLAKKMMNLYDSPPAPSEKGLTRLVREEEADNKALIGKIIASL
jgi:hypothetical protein